MLIHPHKTKCMVLTTKQKHQRRPLTLNLTLGEKKRPVQQVREHRVLGVMIDEELMWQSHKDNICKHFSKNLFLLSKRRHYVDNDCFQARLLWHINCC